MPAICKLSFLRISMSQQTSATTCKAHDFYYSIKIRQMPGISVDINVDFDAVGSGAISYTLEREPEMFIKTQLLFVYFKVIEESHYAFDIKKKIKKKHETENSKLKPGYSALKRAKGRSCCGPGNITRQTNGI